jgi:hypothetical protein
MEAFQIVERLIRDFQESHRVTSEIESWSKELSNLDKRRETWANCPDSADAKKYLGIKEKLTKLNAERRLFLAEIEKLNEQSVL